MENRFRSLVTPEEVSQYYSFEEADDFKLGTGAFSSVYKALHRASGCQVAIKVIDKTDDDYWTNNAYVQREIEILLQLPRSHDIMDCFEVLETDDRIFIVIPLFHGEELFKIVNNKLRLSEADACHYFYSLIKIMQKLENNCIAHRDIKADNILVNVEKDLLMLIDFGFGFKYVPGHFTADSCGTLLYAAPELHTKEKHDPIKADIWSTGVLLYFMLSGFLPFYHQEPSTLSSLIMMGEYKMPAVINHEAQDLIRQLLSTSAAERPTFDQILMHPWINVRKLHAKHIHSIDWHTEHQHLESQTKSHLYGDILSDDSRMQEYQVNSSDDIDRILSGKSDSRLSVHYRIVYSHAMARMIDSINMGDDIVCDGISYSKAESRVHSDNVANAYTGKYNANSRGSDEFDIDAEYDDDKKKHANNESGGYRPYKNVKCSANPSLLPDSYIYGNLECKTIIPKRNRRPKKKCGSTTVIVRPGSNEYSSYSCISKILKRGTSTVIDAADTGTPANRAETGAMLDNLLSPVAETRRSLPAIDRPSISVDTGASPHVGWFAAYLNRNRVTPDDMESDSTRSHRYVASPMDKYEAIEPEEYRWSISPISMVKQARFEREDLSRLNFDLSPILSRADELFGSGFSSCNKKNTNEKMKSKFSYSPIEAELDGSQEFRFFNPTRKFQIDLVQVEYNEGTREDYPWEFHAKDSLKNCIISHKEVLDNAMIDEVIPFLLPLKRNSPNLQNQDNRSKRVVDNLLRGNSNFAQFFMKKHRRHAFSIEELSASFRSDHSRKESNISPNQNSALLIPLTSKKISTFENQRNSCYFVVRENEGIDINLKSKSPEFTAAQSAHKRFSNGSQKNPFVKSGIRINRGRLRSTESSSQFCGLMLRENIGKLYKNLNIPLTNLKDCKSSSASRVSEYGSVNTSPFRSTLGQTDFLTKKAESRREYQMEFSNFTNIGSLAQELNNLGAEFKEEDRELVMISHQFIVTDKTAISVKSPVFQIDPLRGMDTDIFVLRGLDLVTELSTAVVLRLVKAVMLKHGLDPYMVK